MHPDANTLY